MDSSMLGVDHVLFHWLERDFDVGDPVASAGRVASRPLE